MAFEALLRYNAPIRIQKGVFFMVYGYIRVSSRDQCDERQRAALLAWGVPPEALYADRCSGKDFQRPQSLRLMRRLRRDDLLVVKSIDRLGRDYAEVMEQWRVLTRERGVSIVVLDMPLLDTRCQRDLTGTLIADIVLNLLSYVAQTEREMIRRRQAEGIAAARARGVRFGPAPMRRPDGFDTYAEMWTRGEISAREAAKQLHVCHKTFLKWAHMENVK